MSKLLCSEDGKRRFLGGFVELFSIVAQFSRKKIAADAGHNSSACIECITDILTSCFNTNTALVKSEVGLNKEIK